jgi:hypothetical protein
VKSAKQTAEVERFWLLRSCGKIQEAKRCLEILRESPSPHLKADLALMQNSLTRHERGGREAQAEFKELEQAGVFGTRKWFQLLYQKALNSYAQGLYAEALEQLILARPLARAHEELIVDSTHLICLMDLGYAFAEELDELEKRLLKSGKSELDAQLYRSIRASVESTRLRQKFQNGDFTGAATAPKRQAQEWSQVMYYRGWISALPYADVDTSVLEQALSHLTRDADFYLRSYRLQTLVGRVYQAVAPPRATWKERIDRLYLWTWRWIESPTLAHKQSLVAVISEIEKWDGRDVLTADDMQMVQNALEWILIFEPQKRTQWSAILRRTSSIRKNIAPLYHYERLCIQSVAASRKRADREKLEIEMQIAAHPLHRQPDFKMFELSRKLITASRKSTPRFFTIDPDSGSIAYGNKRVATSLTLARLLEGLISEGKMRFSDAMLIAYQIQPYDSEIHDAKIQNLVMRLRKVLGTGVKLITRERWIFLDAPKGKLRVADVLARGRLPFEKSVRSEESREQRLRNERSLTLLLKEATSLKGRNFTRQDLENTLQIPKASLTRYLGVWMKRGWVVRSGSGRNVQYRVTFFDV